MNYGSFNQLHMEMNPIASLKNCATLEVNLINQIVNALGPYESLPDRAFQIRFADQFRIYDQHATDWLGLYRLRTA